MCGRVRLPEDVRLVKEELKIRWDEFQDPPKRYNVPPTSLINVVIFDAKRGGRVLTPMRWGLVPSWAKEEKVSFSTFNAKMEGVEDKPAFRDAWRLGRRCLVPIALFYEWRKSDKQPFAISLGNRETMYLAGLWDSWRRPDGEALLSFTIITTPANSLIAPLHDRMPAIIGLENFASWLGEAAASAAELKSMLAPFPTERLASWEVDRRVGNVRSEDAGLSEPLRAGG
jgi:putative SOS response-associated peptidase YedK